MSANFTNIINHADETEREDNDNITAPELNQFEGWECWQVYNKLVPTGDALPSLGSRWQEATFMRVHLTCPETINRISIVYVPDVQISKPHQACKQTKSRQMIHVGCSLTYGQYFAG